MSPSAAEPSQGSTASNGGSVVEVLRVFLGLGLTSFGGPIAHLAYFRRELVEKRRWLGESEYAQLLGLCQFLPGPASSQLGFSLGLLRAGWGGALAAFVGFTLPSAALLVAFAALLPRISGSTGAAAIHSLKLVALVVVAHGVLGMARQLCPDRPRRTIAALAAVGILVAGTAWAQLAVVASGAVLGLLWCRDAEPVAGERLTLRHGRGLGWVLLAVFALLLVTSPFVAQSGGLAAVFEGFYRAGALVFGGGHVVLPLLEETVVEPGWVSRDEFLAGYGAAQAVPGPMFSFAAYLGARLDSSAGSLPGAAVALAGIFLPGFLLVAGALPVWRVLLARPAASRAVAGVNAAVVGLLGAALYDPIWTTAIRGPMDVAVAVVGFTLLAAWEASALWIVVGCVAASVGVVWVGG